MEMRMRSEEDDVYDESHPEYTEGDIEYFNGLKHLRNKEYTNALACFRRSLRHHFHYKIFENIGQCYIGLRRPRKAVEPLLAAVAINNTPKAAYLCAEVLVELKDYQTALHMVDTAVARMPGYKRAVKLQEKIIILLEEQLPGSKLNRQQRELDDGRVWGAKDPGQRRAE
jgi:tetratricopeptide (TPR) repeat protein